MTVVKYKILLRLVAASRQLVARKTVSLRPYPSENSRYDRSKKMNFATAVQKFASTSASASTSTFTLTSLASASTSPHLALHLSPSLAFHPLPSWPSSLTRIVSKEKWFQIPNLLISRLCLSTASGKPKFHSFPNPSLYTHPSISPLTQPCPLVAATETTVPPFVLVSSPLLADSPSLHSKRKISVPTLVAPLLTKPSHATVAPAPPISPAPSPPKSPSDCSFGVAPPLVLVLSCYSGEWCQRRLNRSGEGEMEENGVVGEMVAVRDSLLEKKKLAYMFWVLGYKLNEANALLQATAQSVETMIIGSLLAAISIGVASAIVPLYIFECLLMPGLLNPLTTQPHGIRDVTDHIHYLETEAYTSILKAFIAQSDLLTWGKEGLMTELRKELNVTDIEHGDILTKINSDELIKQISKRSCFLKLDAIKNAIADILTGLSKKPVTLSWEDNNCSTMEISGLKIGWGQVMDESSLADPRRIAIRSAKKEGGGGDIVIVLSGERLLVQPCGADELRRSCVFVWSTILASMHPVPLDKSFEVKSHMHVLYSVHRHDMERTLDMIHSILATSEQGANTIHAVLADLCVDVGPKAMRLCIGRVASIWLYSVYSVLWFPFGIQDSTAYQE
ncbi:hypothetical protein Fmac_028473 [Flemingia macrophylla]|uniref:ENT domain-containing protein n=1 Tax=Flemingia macrophylla TaxID=520843 RepID=A0ABD1L7M0_9FABA